MDSDYEHAVICENGHVTSTARERWAPEQARRCLACGARVLTQCDHCAAPMPGYLPEGDGMLRLGTAPRYCGSCGQPYPWTQAGIDAWQELIRETEGLSDSDRDKLTKSIHDLVRDTPRTPVAVERVKRAAGKLGQPMIKILTSVATEAVKKLLDLG